MSVRQQCELTIVSVARLAALRTANIMSTLITVCIYSVLCLLAAVKAEDQLCSDCGKCKDNAKCSPETCSCPDGCKLFWIGERCDTEIPAINDSDASCAWLKAAEARLIHVAWCQIQSIQEALSKYYGYVVVYSIGSDKTLIKGPIVPHSRDKKIQEAVLTGLDSDTEYSIAIWPYRTSNRQYDYGRKYDSITVRTLSDEEGPHNCSTLPWILFGLSCAVILILTGGIVLLYLKYIRNLQSPCKNNSADQNIHFESGSQSDQEIPSSAVSHLDSRGTPAIYDNRIIPIRSETEGTPATYENRIIPISSETEERPYTSLTSVTRDNSGQRNLEVQHYERIHR